MSRAAAVVTGLSVTELVSWGVLIYAFSAFLVPMRAELGWSTAQLNAGYALGVAVSGVAAVPVGRWMSRHSARWLMTAGSALTVVVLLAWSRVSTLVGFYLVFAMAGLAMASTLYEPAFVLITRRFPARRPRAVLAVTVVAGLASTVFVPAAGALSAEVGWRTALVVFAVVVALVVLPVHALLPLDHRAADRAGPPGTAPAAASARCRAGRRLVTRRRSFRWLTLALATTTAARIGVSVVLVAYLTARGYPLRQATLLAGLVGVLQVVGRLLIAKERGRMPEHRGHIAAFLAQGIGCLLPLTTNGHAGPATATVVAFVLLLGLGFGLPALLRGTLLVDYYGSADYPRTNGVLGAWMVAAQAVGPLLTGAALGFGAGYRLILLAASALFGLGAVALLAAHRAHTGRPRRPAALREDSGKKGPRHASDHGRQR